MLPEPFFSSRLPIIAIIFRAQCAKVKTDYNGISPVLFSHPRHASNANIHLFHFLIRAFFMQRNNAMTKYFSFPFYPARTVKLPHPRPSMSWHGRTF
jgi:hypothetical protein